MSDSHSNRRHRINLHAEEALGRALAELGYVDAAALPAPWAEFIRRAEAGELLGFATVLVEHQLATLDQVDEALEHVEQSGTKVHTRPVRDISSDEALGRTLMARGLLTKEQNKAHWKEFMKQAPNDPQLHYANVLHWAGAVSADQLAEAGVEPGVLDDDAFGETQMEVSRSDAMSAMYEYGTTRGGSSSSGNGDAADPFGMGSVGNPFADPGNDGSADPFADAAVMAPGSDPFAAADAEYAASGRGNSPGGSGSTDFFAGAEAAAMDAAAHDDAPLADPFADAMGARDAFSDSSPSIDPFRDADAAANDETKLDEFPADPFADAANDETQHDEFPADPFADAGAGVSGFADTDDATHDTYVDEQFPADPFADAMEPPPGYEVERGDVDPFADTSVGPLDPELEGMLDEVVQTAATVEDAPADDADAVVVSAADIAAEPESDVDIAMPAPKATRKVVDATADDDDDAGPVLARSDVNVPGVSAPAPDIDMEGEELLGRALWSAGAITVEQLDKSWKEFIARVKDGEDVRFGQVLIERGTLQPQQLIDIAQKIESGEVKVPPRIDVLKTAERQAKALLDSGVTVEELAPAWQEFMDRASSGESVSFADVAAEMGVARPHHSERLAAVAVPGDGDMSESFFDINLATDDLPDSISSITKRVVPEDLRASIREVTSQVSGDEGLEQLDDEPDAVAVDGESVVSAADVPNADADGTPLDAGTLERMPDTRLLDLDGMEAAMSARTANASESSIDLSGLTGELGEGVFEDDVDENLPTANFAAEEEYGRALLAEGLVTLEELDVAWVEFESRVEKGEDCTLEEVLGLRGIVPRDKLAEVRSRMDAGESFHPPSVDFKAEEKLGRALLADRTVRLDKIDAAWQHFLDRVRAGEATSFAQELLEQGLVSKQELLDLRERISKGTARVLPRIELQKEETLGRELIEKGLVGGEEIDETWREFVSRARSGESVSFGGMLVSRGLISRHILEEMGARVELPAEEELPLVESFFDIALDQIEVPDSLSISAELVPKDVIDSIRSATGADDAPDAHLESLDDDPHSEIADVVESQELRDLMTAETQEVVLSAADTPSDGDAGDLADPFADAVDDDAVSIGNTLESLDDEEEDDDALELPEPVLPGYELPPTGVDTRSLNFGAIGAEFGGEMFTDEAEAREPYDSAADEALGRALLVSRLITMDTLDVAFVEFTDRMDRGERVTFDQVLTGKYHIDAAAIADLRARLAAGEEFNPQEIDFAVELAFGRAVQESGRLGLKQIDRAWEDFRDRAQAGEPITFAEAMVEKGLVDAATIAELRRKFDAGELQTTAIINYKSEEKLARSLIEASEISAEALDPVWQQFLTRARAGESVKLADLLQEQGLVDADTLSRHSGERVRDARLATFIDLDANQASLPSTLLIQPGQLTGALAAVTAAASLPTDADEDEIPDAMFDDAVLDDGESEMAETLEMKKPPADWRTAKPAAGPRVTPSGRITAVAGLSDDDLSTDELHFYYEQEQYGLAAVRHGYVRAHQVKPVWEEMLDRIDSGEKTITLLGLLVGYGVLTVEQADAIRDEGVPDADTAVRQRAALQARQRDGVLDTADEEEGALVSPQVITNPADINPIGSLFLDAGALDFALDDADAPDDFVFQEFSESKEIEIKKLPPITVNATTLGSAGGTQQGAASSTQHALPQPTQAQIEAIYANDAAFLRQQEDYGFKAIDRKWLVADAVHPVWDEMIIRRVHGDKVSDLPALFVERGILTPAQADELRKAEATPQVHAAKKLAAQQPAGSLFIDASALDSALDFDEDEFVMPELQVDDREDSLIPDVQAYTAPTSDESINMMAGDEVRRATAAAGAGNTQMMGDDDRVNAGVTGPGVNDSIAAQMTLFEIGAGTTSGIGRTEGGSSPGSRSGDGSLRSGRRFGSFGTSSSAGASGMGLPPRTLGATAGNTSDAGGAGIARQMGFGNLVDLSGKNKGFTDRMGRYLIMGRIGKGGMGEILNARDADLNRDLAMKVMLAGSDAKRSQLEKFLVEAQVTGQLEHPNIVPVHELGLTNDGRLYFTMKYVRGKSMQQILEAMGEREIERAARKSRGSRGSRSKADVSGIAVTAAATATGGGSVTGGPGGQTGSGTGTGTGTAAGGVTAGSSRGGGRSSSGSGSSDALLSGPMTGVQTGPTKYKIREYTLAELLEIYLKICDAVAFAHSRGVVHRDLKPENVMVGEFGEVQVMDWGLAKVRGKEDRVEAGVKIDLNAGDIGLAVRGAEANIDVVKTMDGTILGTPVYMPPEQARGDIDQIDHRSDIYSLGAILYQVLTLKQPLVGRTAIEILVKVAKGDIQWPSERTPERNVSAELEAVVKKAMAAKKEKRYDTVEDLKSDVRAFLEGRALSAVSYSPMALAMKWVKRNKTLAGGIAAVFVVMIGMIAIFNAISEASKSAFVEARKVEAAEAYEVAMTLRTEASALRDQTIAAKTADDKERLAGLLATRAADAMASVQEVVKKYDQALARDPQNQDVKNLMNEAIEKKGELQSYTVIANDQRVAANTLRVTEAENRRKRDEASVMVADAAALLELAAPGGMLVANGVVGDRFNLTEPRFDLIEKAVTAASNAAANDPENPAVKRMVDAVAALRARASAQWKTDQEQAAIWWQARDSYSAAVVSTSEANQMRADADEISARLQAGGSTNITDEGAKLSVLRGKAFDRYLTAWNSFARSAELYTQIPGAEKDVAASRSKLLETLVQLGTLATGNGEFVLAESWLNRGDALFEKKSDRPSALVAAWELLRNKRDLGQKYDDALSRARTAFGDGTNATYSFDLRQDALNSAINYYGTAQGLDFRVDIEKERSKARYELEVLRARELERNENWTEALAGWNRAETLAAGLGELQQSLASLKSNFISDTTDTLEKQIVDLLEKFRNTPDIDAGLVVLSRARASLITLGEVNPAAKKLPSLTEQVTSNEREVNAERNTPDGFVYVRGGSVAIGTVREPDRNPVVSPRPVLESFYMSKYETTVAEYRRFVAAKGYTNKALWSEAGWKWLQSLPAAERKPVDWDRQTQDRLPVFGVSAYEVEAYVRWLSSLKPEEQYAMPDEYQWEMVARHKPGDYLGERLYPWGNGEWRDGGYTQSSMGELRPVGTNPSDISGFKVADLGGNVSEWVRGRGPEAGYGLRGASSLMPVTHARRYGLTTKRSFAKPTMRLTDVGFRVVRNITLKSN